MKIANKPYVLLLAISSANIATAGQIAYDGFAYLPGTLNGNNGGVGFSTPWLADPAVLVQPPGLTQPVALPSTGLEIGGLFNAARMLSNPLNQPVYWASFEIQSNPGNDQVFLGLDTVPTGTPFLSFGRRLDHYFVDVGGMPSSTCCVASGSGVTDLLVVRFMQTGIFTNDLAGAWRAFSELEVGGVIVNDVPTYRIDNMPYGGVKDSGFGREGLRWAIEDMTEIRIMVLAQPQ